MKIPNSSLVAGLAILACCLGSGCAARLKFLTVEASTFRANVGDVVTVSWSYENDENLAEQLVHLRSVTVFGVTELIQPVDRTARQAIFVFQGPVTVELVGTEEEGFSDHVAFEVGLDGDAFLSAFISGVTDPNYPRLGVFREGNVVEPDLLDVGQRFLTFHQFAAFFDPTTNKNGRIDSLVNLLSDKATFRAFSQSTEEAVDFELTEGCLYPLISPADSTLGQSDAIVFGGALIYTGEQFNVKAPDDFFGEVAQVGVRSPNGMLFEPIFLSVSMRMNYALGTADLTEIQLGNLNQGLVTTLFSGDTPDREFGSLEVDYDTDGTTEGKISGLIKLATVGFGVKPVNAEFRHVLVGLDFIDWNLPFRFDSNLDVDLDLEVPG